VAHRRAAELLDGEAEGALPRVAAHLLACGPAGDRWVVQRLAEAAREALERGAPEIAASCVRRALAEPPETAERAALLLSLGSAEWSAGQPDAIGHLEQALAGAANDHRTLARASGQLGRAYYVTDHSDLAVEVLERALAAVGETDARLALRLEANAAMAGMTDERTAPAAIRRAEGLHGRLRTLTDPPLDLLVTLAYNAARANRADEAQELAEQALACEPYPPPFSIINPLMNALMLVECYDRLQQLCEDVLTSARHRGAIQELAGISVWRAAAAYDCGALADAEADARWALEHGAGVHRIRAVADLIRVLIERDELQEAEDVLEQFGDPRGSRSIEVPRFLFARGQLRRAQGRLQEALDDLLECGQRYDLVGQVRRSSVQWSEVALAHAALDSIEEGRRLARKQLALARAAARPRMLGISLRVSGLMEGGDTGVELLADAVRALERSQSPLELARALTDYGTALRRAGRRVNARAELERALDLAHRSGAQRTAARARAELIAAGAKPRRDAITGRDALTAAELRVARLAAEGLTNREIAQALFITTRTAKGHLSRAYHKLGITRRGQLAGALTGPLDRTRDASAATAAIS
jgi:DNA-binding CsgD family transcriptional regulator